MMKTFVKILLLTTIMLPGMLSAATLDEILAMSEEPTGIVVEVLESGPDDLEEIIPAIQAAARQLRKRFPDLPVAVVSHGYEQFALTKKNIKRYPELETGIKDLVDGEIDVHVCGTHASWYGITPEEYPEYINVSATGPAQINDYMNLGYIKLDL